MPSTRPHAELVSDTADLVWHQLRLARGRTVPPAEPQISARAVAAAAEALGNILLAEEADAQDYTDYCQRWRATTPFTKLLDARIAQSALTGFTARITEEELGASLPFAHHALSLECKRCYFDRYMGYTEDGRAWSIEIGRADRPAAARWPASHVEMVLGHHL